MQDYEAAVVLTAGALVIIVVVVLKSLAHCRRRASGV